MDSQRVNDILPFRIISTQKSWQRKKRRKPFAEVNADRRCTEHSPFAFENMHIAHWSPRKRCPPLPSTLSAADSVSISHWTGICRLRWRFTLRIKMLNFLPTIDDPPVCAAHARGAANQIDHHKLHLRIANGKKQKIRKVMESHYFGHVKLGHRRILGAFSESRWLGQAHQRNRK